MNKFTEYENYLELIATHIDKFFEQQKPYIFCKEGCSYCCTIGQYPLTQIEFDYIKEGFEKLPDAIKKIISKKTEEVKTDFAQFEGEKFQHCCPFLVDKKCAVYAHRPLICRSFGLIKFYFDENGTQKFLMPECVDRGLNYSNIYNLEYKVFDSNKFKELKAEFEPMSYNLSQQYLHNNEFTQNINFGKTTALINFLSSISSTDPVI